MLAWHRQETTEPALIRAAIATDVRESLTPDLPILRMASRVVMDSDDSGDETDPDMPELIVAAMESPKASSSASRSSSCGSSSGGGFGRRSATDSVSECSPHTTPVLSLRGSFDKCWGHVALKDALHTLRTSGAHDDILTEFDDEGVPCERQVVVNEDIVINTCRLRPGQQARQDIVINAC